MPPTRGTRLARIRLILHFLMGVLTVATVYRWSGPARKQVMIRRWSQRLLALCGITLKVHVHGEVLGAGAMVVSNHVSWLDIYVIDAWRPTPFVSKSEIARWPVIGWLAASIGTVFIQRERRADAKRVVDQLSNVLRNDGLICLFPEGTTTDGRAVAPFHANILQAAVSAGAPVQPLCLMYEGANGCQSLAAAYIGDMTMRQSLEWVLSSGPLTAHLHVGAPLFGLTDRRSAAAGTHAVVADALAGLQAQVQPVSAAEAMRVEQILKAAGAEAS